MTTSEPQGSGPSRSSSSEPAEIIRSEERLRVGTRTEVSGRVRVRKVVTSREVTQTFTLRREELVVEQLPADGAAPPVLAGGSPPSGLELVLHEEQVVVVPVPVERVRVRVERVQGDVEVSELLRREQVEVDVDPADPAAG